MNLSQQYKKKLKRTFLSLTSMFGKIFIHKSYMAEIEFFDRIRGGMYSDQKYLEAQLRNAAHQVDKGLLRGRKTNGMDMYAKISQNLLHKLEESPDKRTNNTMLWAKKVLKRYNQQVVHEENTYEQLKEDQNSEVENLPIIERIIKNRRSIRSFGNRQISIELRSKILEAGLWAPSGCNRQNIEYLVLTDKDDIKFCQRIAGEGHSFPQMASFCVVVLVDCRNIALPSQRHMAYLEAGAAIQNMLLYAHCADVGSCWLFWAGTGKKNEHFWQRFNLAHWLLPVSMVCFGYVERKPFFTPERKSLKSAVHIVNSEKQA